MRHFLLTLILPTVLLISGCGKSALNPGNHDEGGHDHHGSEGGGAAFKEGKGIGLLEETKKAIGLETAEVASVSIEPSIPLTAQVYQTASETEPFAMASATTTPEVSREIRPGARAIFTVAGGSREGTVRSIDTTQQIATGRTEVLLEIPDPDRSLIIGTFAPASVQLPQTEITGIPRSAVLETSAGKFAYVQNGGHFLRTPITTGVENAETVEVSDGLYEGDVIATTSVETLHLIELRATKGGGHSH